MVRKDLVAALLLLAAISFFVLIPSLFPVVGSFMQRHDFMASFLKFAVLGTFGESIALRITRRTYMTRDFGLAPRLLMWGGIGLCIHAAFTIFAAGTPPLLAQMGVDVSEQDAMGNRLLLAFCISLTNNLLFAPLFMTAHAVVALHIEKTGGTIKGLFSPLHPAELLRELNWDMLWGFVMKKTLPFFWIPAHTVTFMLPPGLRIIFAALLGVVLGIILALGSPKKTAEEISA